jgi:hypothetical protein
MPQSTEAQAQLAELTRKIESTFRKLKLIS